MALATKRDIRNDIVLMLLSRLLFILYNIDVEM